MFDLDRWREIFQSISKNKLRSVMSGFTVAFAILLFTLLFGIVSGLSNSELNKTHHKIIYQSDNIKIFENEK